MANIEEVHKTIDNSYRNIIQGLSPGVKQLLVTGKLYQKAIINAVNASKAYTDCVDALATSAKGAREKSVTDIGKALNEISQVLKEVNGQFEQTADVFLKDVLNPLDRGLDKESKMFQRDFKMYRAAHKHHLGPYKRALEGVQRHNKKRKNQHGFDQKGAELERELMSKRDVLLRYHEDTLRKVLRQQRNKYVDLLDSVLVGVRDSAFHTRKSHEVLTGKLETWASHCVNPNILPASAEQLIASLYKMSYARPYMDTCPKPTSQEGYQDESRSLTNVPDVHAVPTANSSPTSSNENLPSNFDRRSMDDRDQVSEADTDQNISSHENSRAPSPARNAPSHDGSGVIDMDGMRNSLHRTGLGDVRGEAEHNQAANTRLVDDLVVGKLLTASASVTATSTDVLSYNEGDCIEVKQQTYEGWQVGVNKNTGEEGWFYKELFRAPRPPPLSLVGDEKISRPLPTRPPHPPMTDVNFPPPPPSFQMGGEGVPLPPPRSDTDSGHGEESSGSHQRNHPPLAPMRPRLPPDWRHGGYHPGPKPAAAAPTSSSSSQRSISPPPPPPPLDMNPELGYLPGPHRSAHVPGVPPLHGLNHYHYGYLPSQYVHPLGPFYSAHQPLNMNNHNNYMPPQISPEQLKYMGYMQQHTDNQNNNTGDLPPPVPRPDPPEERPGGRIRRNRWSQVQAHVKETQFKSGTHPPRSNSQPPHKPPPASATAQQLATPTTRERFNSGGSAGAGLGRTPSQRSYKNKPAPPPPTKKGPTGVNRSTSAMKPGAKPGLRGVR